MPNKFDSPLAEWLYIHNDPDDQVGSSSEGVGWAGLYRWEGMDGGVIVWEKTDGDVREQQYRETPELFAAWMEVQEALDMDGPEPEEGDWVIQDTKGGYTISQNGQVWERDGVGGVDPILEWISERMDEGQFFPNVWHVSDHGNYTLLDLHEMGIR